MKSIVKNILLIISSLVLIFVLAEIAFRIYTNVKTTYDIEMHKYALTLKKRSKVPGLSHEHIPNSSKKLMGVDLSLNNLGFRGIDLGLNKLENEKRVLLVGSSITLGWGVPEDETFASKIETYLNSAGKKINVVNSGIGNYNTVLEEIRFQRLAPIVKPDAVILHYFINDAEIISSKSSNIFIKYSYLCAFFYVKIKETLVVRGFVGETSSFTNIGEYYEGMYTPDSKGWSSAKKSIQKMKRYCLANKISFLVMIQPDLHEFGEATSQKKVHNIINEFLVEENISSLDLFLPYSDAVKRGVPSDYWVSSDDSHPNARGHQIIYESLKIYINSNVLSNIF